LITGLPEGSAAELAQALTSRVISLPGVNGAEGHVTEFAAAWHQLTGVRGEISQRQRLYRLGDLVRPGSPRALYSAFAAAVGQDDAPGSLIADRLRNGQLMLWEVDGEPVSIAGVSPVLGGVARIGPVFTPAQWRGRGYGGAVTAAIGDLAAGRGATSVVLFT